ncbi:hypothetical protein A35E_00412 [secondary endosymbiont of Heteropsylla cubana]|uniref:SlyX protein n=1 Tax=secondary endosymbiont of Heteropsylla cubana TaxID=134287 RepID=J3VUA5_9ENTR|nr:SlyX family protein [secondary endosymbiont of Heteropsylla cubana]AFP85706.1 hypothetical protein A35E_00412 [secondary endosymbiont of Heteropsylla cubana]
MKLSQLKNRIDFLEGQISFQEITIEALNQSILTYQHDIRQLQKQCRFLFDNLCKQNPSLLDCQFEEISPPHY